MVYLLQLVRKKGANDYLLFMGWLKFCAKDIYESKIIL